LTLHNIAVLTDGHPDTLFLIKGRFPDYLD